MSEDREVTFEECRREGKRGLDCDCPESPLPKRRIIEHNAILSSATEFGKSTRDITEQYDALLRERDKPLVGSTYDAPGHGHSPDDVLRITAHDLTTMQTTLAQYRAAVRRRGEQCDEMRAAPSRFVSYHSGHVLPPDLASIQWQARKALGD